MLKHDHDGRDLQLEYAEKTLQYVQQLWGRDVAMETVLDNQRTLLDLSGTQTRHQKIGLGAAAVSVAKTWLHATT